MSTVETTFDVSKKQYVHHSWTDKIINEAAMSDTHIHKLYTWPYKTRVLPTFPGMPHSRYIYSIQHTLFPK